MGTFPEPSTTLVTPSTPSPTGWLPSTALTPSLELDSPRLSFSLASLSLVSRRTPPTALPLVTSPVTSATAPLTLAGTLSTRRPRPSSAALSSTTAVLPCVVFLGLWCTSSLEAPSPLLARCKHFSKQLQRGTDAHNIES